MGFGLIANAMAGGMAGAGAAGERAFARLGEQQGRMDLEEMRSKIEMDRQMALERYRTEARRGDLDYASDLKRRTDERERGEVAGIVDGATKGLLDGDQASPATPGQRRDAARDALLRAGRIKEAGDYDKAATPEKPTVVNTGYGGKSTVIDRDGKVITEVDNGSDLRADADALRALRSGRAPKALTQSDRDRVYNDSIKFGDRLALESPHPLADPLATDKEARKDTALQGVARSFYATAMQKAIENGQTIDPSQIERAIREVAPIAHKRAVADAEKKAGAIFDAKGRLQTGGEAMLKELGIRATDRDGFVRAYRDARLGIEAKAVMNEYRQRSAGKAGGASAPATGRNVTDRQREDRGFTPEQGGLVDAAQNDGDGSMARELERGQRNLRDAGAAPSSEVDGPITGSMTPWPEIERRVLAGDKGAIEWARKYLKERAFGGSMPDSLRALLDPKREG